MSQFRAWVMIICDHSNSNYADTRDLILDQRTVSGSSMTRCRAVLSLYGVYDLAVIVEADSLVEIHDTIIEINKLGNKLMYTVTYIAASPKVRSKGWIKPEALTVLAMCTVPGKQQEVCDALSKSPEIVIADVVFGDFDVIALRTSGDKTTPRFLRDTFEQSPGLIKTTTTMLPVDFGVVDNKKTNKP